MLHNGLTAVPASDALSVTFCAAYVVEVVLPAYVAVVNAPCVLSPGAHGYR